MTATQNADQFLALLEPLKDSLYRFALRNAWGPDMANDILQEAMMTGWREFGRFEIGTNFRSWMFQILVNSIYRLNKKWRRHAEHEKTEVVDDIGAVLDRENAWSSILSEPDRVMEQLDDRIVDSLDVLMPIERQCLLLRVLEDFSYKEIAEMLEIPMGTAMSHVHRGRMKMREQLTELALESGFVDDDPAPVADEEEV